MGIGLKDCSKCNGDGFIKNKFGLKVECECVKEVREISRKKASLKASEPISDIGSAVKKKALSFGYVPEHRIEDEFSVDVLSENIKEMVGTSGNYGVNIEDLKQYGSLLSSLLTELRMNKLPTHSYLIGASNGFGKTTFVNTAIKTMIAFDRKVVPYMSLSEIAELMIEDYDMARRKLNREKFDDESELDRKADECGWKDFVNADLVFCYLTGVDKDCMWVEMSTLKRLLQLRGNKGKATIVMMSESLDWYWNEDRTRKYIMNELIEVKGAQTARYDKLQHISVSLVDRRSLNM